MAKKAKAGDEAPKSKKKTKGKVSNKKSKPEADNDEDGLITIADLAEEAEITAQSARVKLREAEVEKPGARWAWKDGSKALKAAREVLGL